MSKQFLKPVALAISISLIVAGCGSSTTESTPSATSAASGSTVAAVSAASTAPAAATSAANSDPFDISTIDPSLDVCNDFDGFGNAKWNAANPIPSDQTRWGAFNKLRQKSLNNQHDLVIAAEKDADSAKPGSIEQKIGWLWRSGMDVNAINKAGFTPIKPDLASIAALKNTKDIVHWLDQEFAKGDSRVFYFGSTADFRNAKMQIGGTFQGGLGLPTPEYYTEADHQKTRDDYVKHIAKMFELTGVPAADASKKA
ncbi:MAG: peptidase, partial [Xanthomonadales bacterium]|nr:peptidase [Xanthomonadales bacterium]